MAAQINNITVKTLRLKQSAAKEIRIIGFHAIPKITLLDTWSYLLQEESLLFSP